MGRKRVTLDGLGDALTEILEEFGDDAALANEQAIEKTMQEGLRKVKSNSRALGWPKYASDWNKKVEKSRVSARGVLYNNRPGLPHLLEHDHAKVINGKHLPEPVKGKPHAEPVQKELDRIFEQSFRSKLQ